jgi:hypothetical protein
LVVVNVQINRGNFGHDIAANWRAPELLMDTPRVRILVSALNKAFINTGFI